MMSEIRGRNLSIVLFVLFFLFLSAELAMAADTAKSVLKYQWEEGSRYLCSFQINAKMSGEQKTILGTSAYSRYVPKTPTFVVKVPKPKHYTGTAFVVNSDGVLATSAHVIEGETKIEVYLGKKKYVAVVIAYDADRDLALLKIDARDLPTLPLLDSDNVTLDQDIQAVGYPLFSYSGEDVTLSKGTVSRILVSGDDRRFLIKTQIDSSNSGGPLIDQQGQVVGMVSDLHIREGAETIGFAIPSNEVIALLREHAIDVQRSFDEPNLKKLEIANRVTSSVAFLKIQSGSRGFAYRKVQTLAFESEYHEMGIRNTLPIKESGTVTVDSAGKIIFHEGKSIVPYIFSSLATIGIEPLPGDGRKSWNSFRFVTLSTTKSASTPKPRSKHRLEPLSNALRPPSDRPRYGSNRYGSSNRSTPRSPSSYNQTQRATTQQVPAVEEVQYSWVDGLSKDGTVPISKTYRLYTIDGKVDGKNLIEVTTEGQILWDKNLGCISQSNMKGHINLVKNSRAIHIPVEFEYHTVKKINSVRPRKTTPKKNSLTTFQPKLPSVRKISLSTTEKISKKMTPSVKGLSQFNPDQ